MRSRAAWAIAVVSAVLVAVDVWISAQAVALTSETAIAVHGFPLVHGACVGSALMGALIVSRYERHPIGWLLSAVGLITSISLLCEAYAFWVLERDGPGSQTLGSAAAWLSQLVGGQIVIALLAWMYLLAPDGDFLTRRWRYAALVPGIGALLCLTALMSVNPTTFDLLTAEDRFGPVRVGMISIGFTLISLGMVAALVSMVLRLRRSTGEKRQQLRLIALSAGLAAAALVVLFLVQGVAGESPSWASQLPLFASFFLMPILFAVAVLRYRLYDLDLIISRTVVVAAATTFAAVGYTTLVVLAGRLVEGRVGGFWLSLLATALVALAFQPLRRSVVRLANRAAFGTRAQPYEALADFSRRLSEAPDPDDFLPAVAEAAARAVSARGAQATLDVPGAAPVGASWGWSSEQPDRVVPVRTDGREIGRIAVVLPRGRALRSTDLGLLDALADQTAVAFRNTSLASALAGRVAELDRTTRELVGSRRRLVEADDAARRTLESEIARDVLPFLEALPQELRQLRATAPAVDRARLERMVVGVNTALESLRELTRGVFPTQLATFGLGPALRSLLGRSGAGAHLTIDENLRRYPPRVEAAVYFCCAEALLADAAPSAVVLTGGRGRLELSIRSRLAGMDLQAVTDRAEAVGGRVSARDDRLVLTIPVVTEPESALVGSPAGALPSL